MRNLLFATVALATMGVTAAAFAGGPTGGIGTNEQAQPSSGVTTPGTSGSNDMNSTAGTGMSGSSDTTNAGSGSSEPLVQAPSGGKGGYPPRQSNGCPASGSPQSTTAPDQNC